MLGETNSVIRETEVSVGQRLQLDITDIAFGGEGVGRVNQFVVFVPFVLAGEQVEAEVVEVKRSFARARLVQVLKRSPQRVTPACEHFGVCGGCQYQHLAYPAQLQLKREQVAELFARLGGFERELVAPVVPCSQPYHYRNRIMVRSQWNKVERGLNIGFLRHDCRLVVDVQDCPIAEPVLNQQLRQVRAHPPPRGGLKIVLRVAPTDWEVPPDSFFQTNFHLLPKLVEVVRERLLDQGARYLVDAYCGVGFFSLELADVVEEFIGIELDPQATLAARRNASRRGRSNGQFLAGTSEALLGRVLRRHPSAATAVLLDPPRAGCEPACLEELRQNRPGQILYVSCHPATLARDLKVLCAGGVFGLAAVVPLDMFPQTQHVECVADLRARARSRS